MTTNSNAERSHTTSDSDQSYKLLTPKEASEIIIDGMERDKFRVLAGKDSKMLDVTYRLNPRKAADIIAKKLK